MNIRNYWNENIVRRWRNASRQHRILAVLIAVSGLSLAVFGVYGGVRVITADRQVPAVVVGNESAEGEPVAVDDIPDHFIRRKLDGAYVEPAAANRYPLAVMIDNDPNARLQSGLAHAQIVYEVKAEAGITRFLALFAGDGIDELEVGPVRSARPYFVRWAQGYDALYTHVGGSPEALEYLGAIDLTTINEFYSGKYFWRADHKFPPHNVYTTIENLRTYLDRLGENDFSYRPWQYKNEQPAAATASSSIAVNYSVNAFAVRWEYDSEKNAYRRFMGNSPHNDADGTPIYAKNVIIMTVPATVVDEEFRRHMSNIGSGNVLYCLDGACYHGTWQKSAATEREIIRDTDGEEVRFNGGATWVQVVQGEGEVEIEE